MYVRVIKCEAADMRVFYCITDNRYRILDILLKSVDIIFKWSFPRAVLFEGMLSLQQKPVRLSYVDH